jgi:hypothetical protein
MAISAYSTASPTIGTTEYSFAAASTSLPTVTDVGCYALVADLNALVAGDEYLIQLYEKGATSGTKRLVDSWNIFGPSGKPVYMLPAPGGSMILGNGWDLTIKKIAGTDRAIPFTLWQIA